MKWKIYVLHQKICQAKFVDLIETKNFAFLLLFPNFTYYGQKIEFSIFNISN